MEVFHQGLQAGKREPLYSFIDLRANTYIIESGYLEFEYEFKNFYNGEMFPAEYGGDLFIAYHGLGSSSYRHSVPPRVYSTRGVKPYISKILFFRVFREVEHPFGGSISGFAYIFINKYFIFTGF